MPNPASAKAFDRYAYVYNNPINASDPSGHDPLGSDWQAAFKRITGRDPLHQDCVIRLFSLAYPAEWDPTRFYNETWGIIEFGDVLHAVGNRNWNNLRQAVLSLLRAYSPQEMDFFVRDIGALWGGIQDRLEQPNDFAAIFNPRNPTSDFVYIGSDGIGQFFDPKHQDANVHHWAWGVTLGYFQGVDRGAAINTTRDTIGAVGALAQIRTQPQEGMTELQDSMADILLGNVGAMFGDSLRGNLAEASVVSNRWDLLGLPVGRSPIPSRSNPHSNSQKGTKR